MSSEWDASTLDQRWAWLKVASDFNSGPMSVDEYTAFAAHAKALCFGYAEIFVTQFTFSPQRFIEIFSQCGWVSKNDLKRIYKSAEAEKVEKYAVALSKAMRRYMIVSPLRQAHFLGQGAVESDSLRSMQEASMSGTVLTDRVLGVRKNSLSLKDEGELGHWYGCAAEEDDPWFRLEKYNSHNYRITGSYSWVNGNVGDVDAQKFRGRGFKQLTGRSNYADYWVYRGWIQKGSFDESWWSDAAYQARNAAQMKKVPANIDRPELIVTKEFNCMDSGGWYMTFKRPNVMKAIDGDSKVLHSEATQQEITVSRAVTFAINGGYIDAENRLRKTRSAKDILL